MQVGEEVVDGVVGDGVGGSSVTCGGMAAAIGSPKSSRAAWSRRPQGSGMVTATPWIGMGRDSTAPRRQADRRARGSSWPRR